MKDNFSTQAGDYAAFRPRYTTELVDFILSVTPDRNLAWDCATGNGQLATLLAPHFKQVIATDGSAAQIDKATQAPNIEYRVEKAEHPSLPDNSVDLLTVAQAVHWFDFDAFYAAVRRVLRPGGVIALIGYPLSTFDDPKIETLVQHFYKDITGPYWDAERRHLDEGYRTIPFPFHTISPVPEFSIRNSWSLDTLVGYLGTWSAVQHYKRQKNEDPIPYFRQALQADWPSQETVGVTTQLLLKIGHL